MNFNKIKSDLEKVYDELAQFWGKDGTLHDWGSKDLKVFSTLVKEKKGKVVLDLGCGSGVQTKMLLDEGLEVLGLDISRNMIEQAKKKAPKAKYIVGDMTKLTFRANSFDGVWARASLLHIPKQKVETVLKNIAKVLKPQGIFYLALKEGEGEREIEQERYGRKVNRFFSFFQEEEIAKLIEQSGFEVLSVEHFKKEGLSTPWLIIFAQNK